MYRPYGWTPPTAGSVSVDAAVRDLVQDFCTAFNTGNYDQCAATFAPDGFFMSPFHEQVRSGKAIERLLQELGDAGYSDLRQETVQVEASGDLAAEVGRYSVVIRQADGSSVEDQGSYLNCWRRLGAWRLAASCWSSHLPRPAGLGEKQPPAGNAKVSPSPSQKTA